MKNNHLKIKLIVCKINTKVLLWYIIKENDKAPDADDDKL